MISYLDQYKAFAQSKGWEITTLDKQLIRQVFATHEHFTQHDLGKHSKLENYSTRQLHEGLQRLVDAGMIRKIYFNQGQITYEHVYGHVHHDHLVCLECGKIQEFRDEKIEERQQAISQEYGYQLVKHSLHLLGLCRDCQNKLQDKSRQYGVEAVSIKAREDMLLSVIPNGEQVKVIKLEGGQHMQQRLQDMGIAQGVTIQVLSNRFAGPMIIKVKGTRLALGHNLTHKIIVER